MGKVFGMTEHFALIDTTGNRTVVNYGKEEVDEINSTWHEVSFSKAHSEKPSIEQIKTAIIEDINADIKAKIINGFEYTILHGQQEGTLVRVWLSDTNQQNFVDLRSSADDIDYPVRYKVGQDDKGDPVYEYFADKTEIIAFSKTITQFIHQCQEEGWNEKDSFDFTPYEEALEAMESEE